MHNRNKRISKVGEILLYLWNIGWFIAAWWGLYNRMTYGRHWRQGGIGSTIIFIIVYAWFCRTYHAFRFASATRTDTVFGQAVATAMADLTLYLECCVANHRLEIAWPMGIAFAIQLAGILVIVVLIKACLVHFLTPQKVLLVYGSQVTADQAIRFARKLELRYPHIFRFKQVVSELVGAYDFETMASECGTVILYEVTLSERSRYMKYCSEKKINFYFTPHIEDIMCQGSEEKNLTDTPILKYRYGYDAASGYFGKRAFDIVLSMLMLVMLSPIMIVTAIAIKAQDGGPVFFRQDRCTKGGRVFSILKFRSMIVDAEKKGAAPATANDDRITKVGRFIRATRIDELPQLINILIGDMSFVGPRPERVEHVEAYTKEIPEFAYRLRVKGGLTGYAQIWGKYNTSAYDKLRYDLMYIENQSFYLDFKILVLTFRTVFQKESTEGFTEDESRKMNEKTVK